MNGQHLVWWKYRGTWYCISRRSKPGLLRYNNSRLWLEQCEEQMRGKGKCDCTIGPWPFREKAARRLIWC